jgi:hypothetical protein
MALVYRNSVCNLAYPFAPDHVDMEPRPYPTSYLPCVLYPASDKTYGIHADHARTKHSSHIFHNRNWQNIGHWPLFSRALVLQERILCARTIFFGHHKLIWECSSYIRDERMGTQNWYGEGFRKAGVLYTRLENSQSIPEIQSRRVRDQLSRLWEDLVREYRLRSLTRPEDRTIAFVGTTRALHSITNMTYLAEI